MEANCDIMFLVERKNKVRLMSFKSNPWLRKDEYPKKGDDRVVKDSIYLFSGIMARPESFNPSGNAVGNKLIEGLV